MARENFGYNSEPFGELKIVYGGMCLVRLEQVYILHLCIVFHHGQGRPASQALQV